MFDQVRAALLRPDVLTAGEQPSPCALPPTTNCSPPSWPVLNRKLDAVDAERRRLIDAYQAGLIELPELQRRATESSTAAT